MQDEFTFIPTCTLSESSTKCVDEVSVVGVREIDSTVKFGTGTGRM